MMETIIVPCILHAFPLEDAWYYDGLHPNEKGYERFADMVEAAWRIKER